MKDLSVPMNRLQLSILPFIFASGLLVVVYGLIWGWNAVFEGFDTFLDFRNFVPTFILGVIAHEGLHGTGWKYTANLKCRISPTECSGVRSLLMPTAKNRCGSRPIW